MNVAFKSTLSAMLCASLLLAGCSTPAPKKPAERYQPPAGIKVAPPLLEKPPAQTATPQPVAPQPAPAATTPPLPATKPLQPTPTPAPQPAPKPAVQTTPAPQPAVKSPAPAASVPAAAALTPTPTKQPPAPVKPATPQPVATAPVAAAKTSPAKPAETVALAAPKATPVVQEPIASDTITPETIAPETIKVSLDHLPLSIHDQWTLDRNESRCILHSTVQKMEDGQGGTSVQLQLSPTELTFTTQSDIDLSYTGTGIRIDGGTPFALENVERRTNLAFSRQRSALLGAMKTGQSLELSLGFWPTWPVTQTYSARFPLQHFASAYAAWETCNKLLSHR